MIVKNIEEFAQYFIIGQPIISIDPGSYKTGVAISDINHKIAFPQSVIINRTLEKKISQIQDLISNFNPCALVMGIAMSLQNRNTTNTKLSLILAQELSKITELPIFLQDERGTSQIVYKVDFFYKFCNKKSYLGREDMIAAKYILESVLEAVKFYKNEDILIQK